MGDAFLGSDERMQLAERIESRAEATSQVCGGGFTEHRQAELERVAAHGGVGHRARQGVYGDRRRGEVGVAGAEIDHIDALREQPALDGGDLRHRIAGQRGESLAELGHPSSSIGIYAGPSPPVTALASTPIPCLAKNSSQAPRTSAQSPTTRVALGSPSRIIAP